MQFDEPESGVGHASNYLIKNLSKNSVKKSDQKEKEYSAYISNLGAICVFNLMI